jgi:hypothetical protein
LQSAAEQGASFPMNLRIDVNLDYAAEKDEKSSNYMI